MPAPVIWCVIFMVLHLTDPAFSVAPRIHQITVITVQLSYIRFVSRYSVATESNCQLSSVRLICLLTHSADGRFEVSFKANILVEPDGDMMWIPCTMYKSSCTIDVNYFPFDEQRCKMNYGSWTYNEREVKLKPYTTDFIKVRLPAVVLHDSYFSS